MFTLIVSARLKGQHDQALRIGWNAEAFARTKRLASLYDCLKPPPTVTDKRAKGADDVRRMFERLAAKG